MTCSECGLQGHNKRCHLRPDTPSDEWYNAPLDPVKNEMETPLGTRTKVSIGNNWLCNTFNINLLTIFFSSFHLVPIRDNEGPSSQPQQKHTMCQLIPIPKVVMRGLRKGPTTTSIHVERRNEIGNTIMPDVRMEETDISPMVEKFERFIDNEAATRRSARANERRNYNTRSSCFVPPRSR
ncbi:hypothetical protein Adt_09548 [Abeliophyllum distichum]|uniref:Reverse transcriptase domain-containing protein n=1 Tax=Abeliophyllum distichum TaxID=126358 RepID=A0ABD1UHI8_9LAMI